MYFFQGTHWLKIKILHLLWKHSAFLWLYWFALNSFFCFRYRVWSNTSSLLIKRPTRKTGSTRRVDHITNILSHCLSQTLSVKLFPGAYFLSGSVIQLLFFHSFRFYFGFPLGHRICWILIDRKRKNVSPQRPGLRQVQQPGAAPSLHQSGPAQGPGQTRRCFLWFLYHAAAKGWEVLPGVPGVLLRDPSSVALRVSCLDEAQAGQSYRSDAREALRPAWQAAGGLLSHWPDVSVRSVYDGWAQTPRHCPCGYRADRQTGGYC